LPLLYRIGRHEKRKNFGKNVCMVSESKKILVIRRVISLTAGYMIRIHDNRAEERPW